MQHTTLIVPGFHGSGPLHWQSWIEEQLPGAQRVRDIDWESPVLARWAGAVRGEIDAAPHAVWLVAHSFGCLASVVAAADRPEKVAGVLLVAPADPLRFGPFGLRDAVGDEGECIAAWLPETPLECPSTVVASSNDPWVKLDSAAFWAERWGSRLIDIGEAGHINTESGFGPWPFGLELLTAMQRVHDDVPLGTISGEANSQRGRHGALARVRHHTRFTLNRLVGRDM
ncbi:RBBP9/YdeN family alpha/beta hydrolase [Thauera sinica]|uniref:RBBP9/YdeN family alpha/beta hydrolase n=1 Tax=Thauera sinica TaxID=2665146 RepID=A0ABW1AP46_9RHOO|nr:alpha/beta hydrolase [Thauera sp. K11]ATE59455.1 esterase [Thauera sp. K11]